MTTHDEQTNTASTSTADVAPTARPESSSAGREPSTAQTNHRLWPTILRWRPPRPTRHVRKGNHWPRATNPRAPRPNRRKWGPGLRPLGPNRRPTNRFSPTPTFHGCARAGTMSRRLSSTTQKSASKRPTPSWPRSSNSSRPGSPGAIAARGAVGSRRGGLHGGPSSLAKALPRVLPAAALGLKRLQTEAPCCCVGLLSAVFV